MTTSAVNQSFASRTHQVDPDASQLNFGDDFNNKDTHCLLHSEVQILLEACQAQRQAEEMATQHLPPPTVCFMKCHQYVTTFGKYRSRELIRELRQTLLLSSGTFLLIVGGGAGGPVLHEFEAIQLANLAPKTIEEARSLIPSLTHARIEDYDLQRLVDEIAAAVSQYSVQ